MLKIEEIFQVISINALTVGESYDLEKPQGFETVTLCIHRVLKTALFISSLIILMQSDQLNKTFAIVPYKRMKKKIQISYSVPSYFCLKIKYR